MEGHTSFIALLRAFVWKDARSFAYLKAEKPSLGCYQEAKFPSKKPLQSTFLRRDFQCLLEITSFCSFWN